MALIRHYKELHVYQLAFAAAMRIFHLTKAWPKDETYALTSQIRRSSRAVCGNIAEAWSKRRYPSHFTSKLTDSDAEAAETQNWLEFALACGYLDEATKRELWVEYRKISGGLVSMMTHTDDWCGPSVLRDQRVEYNAWPELAGDET